MWEILIVEDNPNDARHLVDGLKSRARCTVACDGHEAIHIYCEKRKKKQSFDFILLDVQIPQIKGFDVLKAISTEEDATKAIGKDSWIIMITTHKDSLMENYNMGWDEFITKPVDIKILIQHMDSLVAQK